jgi:lysophospholipase L1-like esterase
MVTYTDRTARGTFSAFQRYLQIGLRIFLTATLLLATRVTSAALVDSLGHAPRIMALGDSITSGCCNPRAGYYQYLANYLTTYGYQFSMVGSVHVGGYDIEGHPGWWPKDLVNGRLDPTTGLLTGGIDVWMTQSEPDIVLLHAGTNGVGPSTISYDPTVSKWGSQVADMRSLLDGIFNANPNAYVIMAKIIQTRTPRSDITEFNNQLSRMASAYGNDHLFVVDMENILSGNPDANYVDDVHPSAAGLQIMADAWFPTLTRVLDDAPLVQDTGSNGGSGGGGGGGCTLSGRAVTDPIWMLMLISYGLRAIQRRRKNITNHHGYSNMASNTYRDD